MSKIEPIILDNVEYYTSSCCWLYTINLADIPASKIEEYKRRPDDWKPWLEPKLVGPYHTHIVKFAADYFDRDSVSGAGSWHDVRVYEGKKTVDIGCLPLSSRSFVEIWQRSNSIRQVIVSYKANHSAGYCIGDVEAKARRLRKEGVPLKDLPYHSSPAKPDSQKHYLSDFAQSFLSQEGETNA